MSMYNRNLFIETDKKVYCKRIVSVFKHNHLLVKVFSISDDALLGRAKRQNFKKKTWISWRDLYLITIDLSDL